MRGHSKRENREILWVSAEPRRQCAEFAERSENITDGTADMNANRKSDESVVPATSANNGAAEAPAESAEERGSPKRNDGQAAWHRTQSRDQRQSRGLHGVREAARKDRRLRFTALLHYVLDLWIDHWRRQGRGEVVVVRYADDFVIGFENRSEAESCLEELRERFAKFGLKLHPEKTRLIEFGRPAQQRHERGGGPRPGTFDFLGFTHKCGRTRKHGWFTVHRHSVTKRVRRTLATIKVLLRKRRHWALGEVGRWLGRVVRGWLNYHAVPGNSRRVARFVSEVTWLWLSSIRRRSQRGGRGWTWPRMQRLARRYLPRPRIVHPYPNIRFRARLEGRAV